MRPDPTAATEHLDVLIVGAGVSGIGAAHHLQASRPGTRYAILEARDAIGGTWDLFRYPGIRSDSDLHTFGYEFKPWTSDTAIADGPAIRDYIRETAAERGIDRHVRFNQRVVAAAWSSPDARWTVTVEDIGTGEHHELTASWLFLAGGYYRYDEGYTPHFEGREDFAGEIVHPQHWPEDLDVTGRRVVVIGSGATAVTRIPALAREAAHVTMLQRSPTYILPVPSRDAMNQLLRRRLGEQRAYRITRAVNVFRQKAVYRLAQRFPGPVRRVIRWINAKQLEGTGIDVDVHFKPRYGPWDQRLCIVPDGDLFRALRAGTASVVTDRIVRFEERGVRVGSGELLEADLIVTATGLNLQPMAGLRLIVDGREVVLSETVAYKGLMLSGVPNMVFAVGYTNSSWTLKVDLVARYFCRLLAHLEAHGLDAAVPELPAGGLTLQPLLDFEAGYVLRSLDQLPKQGDRAPWHLAMDYAKDRRYLRDGDVTDGAMRFFAADPQRREPAVTVAA